jgi:hypothetical protein
VSGEQILVNEDGTLISESPTNEEIKITQIVQGLQTKTLSISNSMSSLLTVDHQSANVTVNVNRGGNEAILEPEQKCCSSAKCKQMFGDTESVEQILYQCTECERYCCQRCAPIMAHGGKENSPRRLCPKCKHE